MSQDQDANAVEPNSAFPDERQAYIARIVATQGQGARRQAYGAISGSATRQSEKTWRCWNKKAS